METIQKLQKFIQEMFSNNLKKRLLAISHLHEIAKVYKLWETQLQFINFLSQFQFDQPKVQLAVISQIKIIVDIFQTQEMKYNLLKPLINFCCIDQPQVAKQSVQLIKKVLGDNGNFYKKAINDLNSKKMKTTYICALELIISYLDKFPQDQMSMVKIYKQIITNKQAYIKIIGCKYIQRISEKILNKNQILDILELIYKQDQELPKLLAFGTLISQYNHYPQFVCNILINLIKLKRWRFQFKFCQYALQISNTLSSTDFDRILKNEIIEILTGQDNEMKAKALDYLEFIMKIANQQERKGYVPLIHSLALESSQYLKASFIRNLLKVFEYIKPEIIVNSLGPTILKLFNYKQIQTVIILIKNLKFISSKINNAENIRKMILKPLQNRFQNQKWRIKKQILTIIGQLIIKHEYFQFILIQIIWEACSDQVQAIRNQASDIVISIINTQKYQQSHQYLINRIIRLYKHKNYRMSLTMIKIMCGISHKVKDKVVLRYQQIIKEMLRNSIPNIRLFTLITVLKHKNLMNFHMIQIMCKLKRDPDAQVREQAKMIPF